MPGLGFQYRTIRLGAFSSGARICSGRRMEASRWTIRPRGALVSVAEGGCQTDLALWGR